jgi:hypothetical protein
METNGKNGNYGLENALREFGRAYSVLVEKWHNDLDFANDNLKAKYPFEKSFDEYKVNEWIKHSILHLNFTENSVNDKLAFEFCRILNEWLTPEQIAKVNELNEVDGMSSDVCHSHDFCDPNQAMIDAWQIVMERPFPLGDEPEWETQFDMTLIGNTWEYCKQIHFDNSKIK